MAQVTIYLDDNLLKTLKKAASKHKKSLSAWIGERLRLESGCSWPEDFFALAGSIPELERADQGSMETDIPRESL